MGKHRVFFPMCLEASENLQSWQLPVGDCAAQLTYLQDTETAVAVFTIGQMCKVTGNSSL